MSQKITIDRDKLVKLVGFAAIAGLILVLSLMAMSVGDWLKKQWSSLKPPVIATIDTQKLLTEKAAQLKNRMANANTEAEQQAILAELSTYGEQIALWVKVRAPELCGCIAPPQPLEPWSQLSRHCTGQCIVLNQQSVIAGSGIDLTQAFILENAKQ